MSSSQIPNDHASLAAWGREDPVRFIEVVLGADLWDGQREIVRSVFDNPRTAVKASHATGKTFVAAQIVLAWFYLMGPTKILTTAPTWLGVSRLLWSEIGRGHGRMPSDMGGTLLGTELRASRDWWAIGLSTDEGVRFQGHHAERMLVVIDEAPGVRPDIWEAVEGIRASGDVRLLVIGNPVQPGGPFFDAFTKDREGWATHTISAFDSPNFDGIESLEQLLAMPPEELDKNERPYLVTRRWVAEKARDWGEGTPMFASRVHGDFPMQSDRALFSLAWLDQARGPNTSNGNPSGPIVVGIDVAGPGQDETVVKVRQGSTVIGSAAFSSNDARGDVVAYLKQHRWHISQINVDAGGIGHYFAEHLNDQGFTVCPCNFGSAPMDGDLFKLWKDEGFWHLRERFKEGRLHGLQEHDGDKTVAQLSSILWDTDSSGRIRVESKDAMRKRGVRSPDHADALMLAFAGSTDPKFTDAILGTDERVAAHGAGRLKGVEF